MPVTKVVLFSSGVGYFEHNGMVEGTVSADLRFETAQINDVLKSLVVYDHGGGSVRTITYPANDPINRTLRSFQVNLSGDPPLAEILKQIRGAAVELSVGDERIAGTVLGVEQREKTVGTGTAEKSTHAWMVNVVTGTGIRSVALEDLRNLEIKDEKIRKEMNQALAALVQARDQSKKTVTVHFDTNAAAVAAGGGGGRPVGMGYLVETPIWKSTYRLMLPDATSKAPAELQAWAIVENQTDNDWTNVSLSLVGGRPLGFIELLYQPLYIARPVVQPTIIGNMVPQTYDNGISASALDEQMGLQRVAPSLKLGATSGSNGSGGALFGGASNNGPTNNGGPQAQGGVAASDFAQGVAAIAEAAKIGEMFQFTVENVTLPRQQSSMIPIVAEGVPVDRLSIYSPLVSGKYAMRGLRLHNRTGKFLLGGPVTVMDTTRDGHSYAGDAKIEDIPTGQSRLMSYAIDQDLTVQMSKDSADESLITGTIVKGVLWLKFRSTMQTEYRLQNKSDSAKTVIIEHPVVEEFELKEPAKFLDKTDRVYRFEVALGARETKTFPVKLERTRGEELELVSIKDEPLSFYSKQGEIPGKVREFLGEVAKKRVKVVDLDRTRTMREEERKQVLEEQGNIRENIKVLPGGSKSQENAIADLAARDADLKTINKDIKDLAQKLEDARNDLAHYLATTTVE
jgi:hypothetical protein